MPTRADAVQATREGARFTALTVLKLFAEGAIEIGASAPVVAPLCTALLKVKDVVDAANHNKEELEELRARCDRITVQVIDKAKASKTSKIDVSPLQECVDELKMVAEGYRKQRKPTRMALFRKNGNDIQRLRTRIDTAVRDMGLERVVDNGEKLDLILVRTPALEYAHSPLYLSCEFSRPLAKCVQEGTGSTTPHNRAYPVTHALVPPPPHPLVYRLVYSHDPS